MLGLPSPLSLIVAYVATAVAFLVLDGTWFALAAPKLYRPEIGDLLAPGIRGGPAITFYLIYVAGMVYFVVGPAFARGWSAAIVPGVVLGLVAYGTYDLTCYAVMKVWTLKVTVADMAWGGFATATACTIGVLITRAIVRSAA